MAAASDPDAAAAAMAQAQAGSGLVHSFIDTSEYLFAATACEVMETVESILAAAIDALDDADAMI